MSNRAFVIGNGPSLVVKDLELLKDENTFAVNAIHLLYNQTDWRPKTVVWIDYTEHTNTEFVEELAVAADYGGRTILRYDYAYMVEPLRKNTLPFMHYIKLCNEHVAVDVRTEDNLLPPTEWHLPAFCRYGGSVHVAMQIAILEGAGEIVLLGCDLGFVAPIDGEPDPNHFDPDYGTHSDFPIENRDATLIHAHELAKKYADGHRVKIYNATRGGLLEVYPRVTLEEILWH